MHLILFFLALLGSCQDAHPTAKKAPLNVQREYIYGEYIYRLHDEYLFIAEPPLKRPVEPYPWEKGNVGNLPKITKEYFRCKGSSLNPQRNHQEKGSEVVRLTDCGGTSRHSLPLRNGKEFVYPILLDLLNHIQSKTGKRVVITCGHRCPSTTPIPIPPQKHPNTNLQQRSPFMSKGWKTAQKASSN